VSVRRRPEPEKFFRRFLDVDAPLRRRLAEATGNTVWFDAPESAVRERLVGAERTLIDAVLDDRQRESLDYGYRERIWDTHLPHIRELPRVLPGLFAEAGRRAREAGFDGIELHYAHAYTMASFLSRLNTRDDGYGGPREQRVRLPLEVLGAVRARVGDDYVVGIRYLGDDVVAGGSDVEDAAWFRARLERGEADFVGAARQSLADPDWFRKIRLGYGSLVRRCEFTNYCEGLDQQHKQVTCKLWDRVEVDAPDARLARDGKRRLSPPSWTPPEGDAR